VRVSCPWAGGGDFQHRSAALEEVGNTQIRDNIVSLPLHTVMSEADMDRLYGTVSKHPAGTR